MRGPKRPKSFGKKREKEKEKAIFLGLSQYFPSRY
jgi:hypothetical protein